MKFIIRCSKLRVTSKIAGGDPPDHLDEAVALVGSMAKNQIVVRDVNPRWELHWLISIWILRLWPPIEPARWPAKEIRTTSSRTPGLKLPAASRKESSNVRNFAHP